MNSVKCVKCVNFDGLSDNVKRDILLYGDPRLDAIYQKYYVFISF